MKTLLLCVLWTISISVFCQNIGINTDGSTPDQSAILDVKAATKGLLIPRHTTFSKLAIVNPAPGLIVLDTTIWCICIFTGSLWIDFCSQVTPPSSCNLGMVDFGYFSIEQSARPVADFHTAVTICHNVGSRTRLCTASEWYIACQSGIPSFMGVDWEWVDDFVHEDNLLVIGGNACDDYSIYNASITPLHFRCCCEH